MRATAWATAAVAVLALWLASTVGAGTAEDPEITDAAGDQDPLPGFFPPADILAGWVAPNGTDFVFTIEIGNLAVLDESEVEMNWTFAVGTQNYSLGAVLDADGNAAPTGVATNVTLADPLVIMEVPAAALGDPADGTAFTSMFITNQYRFLSESAATNEDRAPDDGFGRDFVVGGNATAGNGTGNQTDTDTTTTTTTTDPTTTTTTSTTAGTDTTTTTPPTTTAPPDDDGGGSLQDKLLEENRNYFFAALGVGLLLIILAAIGLKRWSL